MADNKYYHVITYYGRLVRYELENIDPESETVIIYARNIKKIQEELLVNINEIKFAGSYLLMPSKEAEKIYRESKPRRFILFAVCDPIIGSTDDILSYSLRIEGKIIGRIEKKHPLKNFVRIKAGEIIFFVKAELINKQELLYLLLDE